MMTRFLLKNLPIAFIAVSLTLLTCSKEPMSVYYPPTIEYRFSLPAGKLPWPHQSPELTRQEYETFLDNIWIIQNYGENTSIDDPPINSIHIGLDIVVEKNAKIYAIDEGIVRSTSEINEFGGTITIARRLGENEWIEWSYGHVWNYQVQPGQPVVRGQYICNEKFNGLHHVHLEFAKAGDGWNSSEHFAENAFLEDFFEYRDIDPPVIDGVYFFKNNSDERFAQAQDGKIVVSGEVDIVVGMREVGQYAHSKIPGQQPFGDRLAVTKAMYVIEGNGIAPKEVSAIDFRTMSLFDPKTHELAPTDILYKWYYLISNNPSWNQRLSYYILSNFDGPRKDHFLGNIDPNNAWRTNQLDNSGNPMFPVEGQNHSPLKSA